MRKLRIVVILLAGLWLIGELAVVPLAERRLEQGVAERARDVANVDADIASFPLVTRLLLTSRVSNVTVTLEDVARQNLTFAQVRFDLEGIEMDRTAFLRQQARVRTIDRGTATATIDVGAMSAVLGRAVSLVGANVRVQGNTLLLGPASFRIDSELLPCELDAHVNGERVIASCTIHEVPELLLRAVQSR